TEESRQAEHNTAAGQELMARYAGGRGKVKFDSDEDGGRPHYEREHYLEDGRPSGWYTKHYGGPQLDIYHRATGDTSHATLHLPQHPEDKDRSMTPRLHPDFDDIHLGKVLQHWHSGEDGEETRRYYEDSPHAEPRIHRWKQRHLGSAGPDLLGHLEAAAVPERESIEHILGHYLPSDFETWDEVRGNINWDHPEVAEFARHIAEHGVQRPVPIDYREDPPRVMNGHTRLIAAERGKVADVPVRQHEGWLDPDDPDHFGNQESGPYLREGGSARDAYQETKGKLWPAVEGALQVTALHARDEMPPDPGTASIPEGHVRLWHYTNVRNVDSIREHGLDRSFARGDAGDGDLTDPSAGIWASTKRPDDILNDHSHYGAVVEFHAHPDEISQNAESPWQAHRKDHTWDNDKVQDWASGYHHVIMRGSVPTSDFLGIHEPHHGAARYMRDDDPSLESYQWVKEHPADDDAYGPYVRGLQALERHPKTAAAVDDHEEWERRVIPPWTGPPLYPGTRSILHEGEELSHEAAARFHNHPDILSEHYVHATTSPQEAHEWGERAMGSQAAWRMEELGRARPIGPGENEEHAYPPRVYQVEPTGDVEPDPHKEGASYRSAAPLRVVREVRPLACHAEEHEGEEHWPDHPHYDYLKSIEDEEDEDEGHHTASGDHPFGVTDW